MYNIYITPRSKKQLHKLSELNKRLYKDALDTISKLHQGQWKGGTRVKKLQGIKDPLYEARLNSGDRLLFTLDKHEIYIHYVFLVHDEVNLRARNTSLSHENSILLESQKKCELEIPDEKIQSIYSAIETNKNFVVNEEDLIKMLETEDLSSISLKLKLLPEQEKVLHKPFPLLLSGGAGSGKSTISIYRLYFEAKQLLESEEKPELLYLCENERLVKEIENQFLQLCKNDDNEKRLIEVVNIRSFNSLMSPYKTDEYYRYIDRQSFYAEFSLYQRGNHRIRKLNPSRVYEELLSVIGSLGIPHTRYLSKEHYFSLPKYEAPLFHKNREVIWGIQEWYSELKQTKGFYDVNDLIFNNLYSANLPQYDLVICDEVQDFNRAKINISLRLLKPERKSAFLLAGDSKQKVNGSQFTWGGLKRQLKQDFGLNESNYHELALNCRNPKPIAELSESLFKIPKKLGLKESIKGNINAPLPGETATLIYGEESSFLKLFDYLNLGNAVLIVPDEKTEKKLKETCYSLGISSPFVLLPHEAKGLEFEEVWLWSLASSAFPHWQRLFEQGYALTEDDKEFILSEIRQMYVSLTRTLSNLYIYEENREFFWNIKELAPIISSEEEDFSELIKTKRNHLGSEDLDKNSWSSNAKHFYEEEQFERCLECLERLSSVNSLNQEENQLKQLAKAHIQLSKGEFEKAGDLLSDLKEYEKAVEAYDHIALFDKIAKTLDKAAFESGITTITGQEMAKKRDKYKVRSFDRRKKYNGSGRLCLRYGNYYEAAVRFKLGDYEDLLEECLIQALDNNVKDNKLLQMANTFFKKRNNSYRQAQVLKLLM